MDFPIKKFIMILLGIIIIIDL